MRRCFRDPIRLAVLVEHRLVTDRQTDRHTTHDCISCRHCYCVNMVNQSSLLCDNWAFVFNVIKFFYISCFSSLILLLYCLHCCATSYGETALAWHRAVKIAVWIARVTCLIFQNSSAIPDADWRRAVDAAAMHGLLSSVQLFRLSLPSSLLAEIMYSSRFVCLSVLLLHAVTCERFCFWRCQSVVFPCQISPSSVQRVAPAGRKTSKSASE